MNIEREFINIDECVAQDELIPARRDAIARARIEVRAAYPAPAAAGTVRAEPSLEGSRLATVGADPWEIARQCWQLAAEAIQKGGCHCYDDHLERLRSALLRSPDSGEV